MKRVISAGLFLGCCCAAVTVSAQDAAAEVAQPGPQEMRSYVSAMYAYTFENSDRQGTDSGQGAALSFGSAINQYWGWEIGGFYAGFPRDDEPGSQPQREYGARLDGLYFYGRNPAFSPYFVFGAGAVRSKLRGTSLDTTDPLTDVGLGFISYFSVAGADVGFRADARYRHTFFDKGDLGGVIDKQMNDAVVQVGLVIPFGDKPAPAKAPPAPVAAAAPEAAEASEPVEAACADGDADGVCDAADLCPATVAGTVIDIKGCPKDVADGAKKKFDDVLFANNRSDLGAREKAGLDKAATAISDLSKQYPALKVDISGHTDQAGSNVDNQRLSERRADTVKTYLVRKGVTADRVSTYGFGESKPVASNDSAEGRALNRRAEVQTYE